MIEQLYDLKKKQIDQKLMEKSLLLSKLESFNAEILITKTQIDRTSVQKFGAISDFTILQMHKNTMRLHIKKIEVKKKTLDKEIELILEEIVQLQKETEQYSYILKEQNQEVIKKLLLTEKEEASEYIQSKYISK